MRIKNNIAHINQLSVMEVALEENLIADPIVKATTIKILTEQSALEREYTLLMNELKKTMDLPLSTVKTELFKKVYKYLTKTFSIKDF